MRIDILTVLIVGALAIFSLWIIWGIYVSSTAKNTSYILQSIVDGVEIRKYPSLVLVTTSDVDENNAFNRLFNYISGYNKVNQKVAMTTPVKSEKIAMTTPVLTEKIAMTTPVITQGTKMSFILPMNYNRNTAPIPLDPLVKLETIEPTKYAVITFSGWTFESEVKSKTDNLLRILEANKMKTTGDPILLRYNDPWTPPFMRRNEIAVKIN